MKIGELIKNYVKITQVNSHYDYSELIGELFKSAQGAIL